MYGLIVVFPFRGISRISASHILLTSGILSISEIIRHVMLLLWLQMLSLVVDMTTVILCLESLSALDLRKLQCVQNSLARIVTNTTKHSHITPARKTLHRLPSDYHCILKTALLVYKFLHSGYPKYLYLSFNLDLVYITHIKAKLMVCFMRSRTLPLQYTSLLAFWPQFSL